MARELMTQGEVGQLVPCAVSLGDEAGVARAVAGAALVVNLVGILAERRGGDFLRVHKEGAERVARQASAAGVARLPGWRKRMFLSNSKNRRARPGAYRDVWDKEDESQEAEEEELPSVQ